nr:MAG TPA: hypothetical protein [Caudoviricetes sp.]DAQ99568.1 MAG TPA: hypothetical protein [Caudoviricetes sp.]
MFVIIHFFIDNEFSMSIQWASLWEINLNIVTISKK